MLNFKSKVFLAPMAGITDRPFRRVATSFGGGVMYSEMVAINALQRKNPKSYRIADVRDEPYPVVVQLVGGDEALIEDAVKLIEDLGACSIDINMGCPVKKIVQNKSGSYLMKDLPLAAKLIGKAVASTKLNVSAKFRAGWDANSINAPEFAKMCESEGAAYVTIHGRTKSQGYSGQADWEVIAAVKDAVKIPVIGNGDVTTPQLAHEMLCKTKVDGVMIGRGTLGSPWLIAQTHAFLESGIEPEALSVELVHKTLLTHIKELIDYYGERLALPISRKYVCWYCKNMPDARRFRERYLRISNADEAMAEVNDFFEKAKVCCELKI